MQQTCHTLQLEDVCMDIDISEFPFLLLELYGFNSQDGSSIQGHGAALSLQGVLQ